MGTLGVKGVTGGGGFQEGLWEQLGFVHTGLGSGVRPFEEEKE